MEKLVVIPTYNEKENISNILHAIFNMDEGFHVLVIDDGSPDGTAQIVKDVQSAFQGQLFIEERTGKLGLGTAYIHGFKWAIDKGYQFIFEMDADFSHNPDDLVNLYNACAIEGADMAIGSRYINGVNVVNWPLNRVLMSYFASVYVKMITGMKIHDATAGFVCYTRKTLEIIDIDKIKFIGYAFQIEMKYRTFAKNLSIIEVPIIFTDRTKGQSKMSSAIFKEAIFGVIALRIKKFFNVL